jgi:hypothetical protein
MNVVDSSGWLEYLADTPNADFFAPAIEDVENLVVPIISVTYSNPLTFDRRHYLQVPLYS